jgi:hypothetical protein
MDFRSNWTTLRKFKQDGVTSFDLMKGFGTNQHEVFQIQEPLN